MDVVEWTKISLDLLFSNLLVANQSDDNIRLVLRDLFEELKLSSLRQLSDTLVRIMGHTPSPRETPVIT